VPTCGYYRGEQRVPVEDADGDSIALDAMVATTRRA